MSEMGARAHEASKDGCFPALGCGQLAVGDIVPRLVHSLILVLLGQRRAQKQILQAAGHAKWIGEVHAEL